jgi:hypothetical protein
MKKKRVKKTAKAAPKKNGEGKYARLRALLLSGKKTFTAEEMMQASGFDERNLKTALTIPKSGRCQIFKEEVHGEEREKKECAD